MDPLMNATISQNLSSPVVDDLDVVTVRQSAPLLPHPHGQSATGNAAIVLLSCAFLLCVTVICFALVWRKKFKYSCLPVGQRAHLIPVSNWRLSASTMSLIGRNLSDQPEPELLSRPDVVQSRGRWEEQLLCDDDDVVFRPTTTQYQQGQTPDVDGQFRLEFSQGKV